jgi:hypothetical protein
MKYVHTENLKDIRWKRIFENFSKSYKLLEEYSRQQITSELEKSADKMSKETIELYFPKLKKMYDRLLEEL